MNTRHCLLLLCLIPCLSWSQTYNLNVTHGFGTETYAEGDTIYIWANPDFNEYVFKDWQGSATSYMLEQNEWLTRIVVPIGSNIGNISAQGTFNDLSSTVITTHESIVLPGKDNGLQISAVVDVHSRIPLNPIGIIVCFHGTGGSGAGFETNFEKNVFFKAGANRNYIMIAADANEKTFGDQNNDGALRWEINDPATDDESNNIDIKMIKALRDTIITRLNLPSDFATFALGVSNGANFADLCAAALQFNASGHMTGNGHPDVYATRPDATPVIFVQSENDQNSSANPAVVLSNYDALLNRGITAEFHWHKKTPVYPFRFARTEDMLISPSTSDSIFQRMVDTAGLLDPENKLLIQDNSGLPSNLLTGLGLSSGSMTDCENQIKIMNADHKFHSHYNNRIIDFFDAELTGSLPINDNDDNHEIYLYPNPANDHISISSTNNVIHCELYSTKGEFLERFIYQSKFNLSKYPSGSYFMKIQMADHDLLRKIIKQ
jgi:predicted esterase